MYERTPVMHLKGMELGHRFGHRIVFDNISFEVSSGASLCLVGRNGSGKSTLLRIIAGLLQPTRGTIDFSDGAGPLDASSRRRCVRLVAPEMNLYDNLTANENLRFLGSLAGADVSHTRLGDVLDKFELGGRGDDFYGAFSSGMRQRLKLAAAWVTDPKVMLLDEPTTNVDEQGADIIHGFMREFKKDRLLVLATNDSKESAIGDNFVELG